MTAEFDPRLAEVYDAECAWAADDDFFRDVAAQASEGDVLDLGCGTGRLTLALADAGLVVTGIDPNPASIAWARAKPGAERVKWIVGTSADAPDDAFRAALMTSHVAQVFVTDEEWRAVLADCHRALLPGGVLSFDMRNPVAKAWLSWTRDASRGEYALSGGRRVETWVDLAAFEDDVATFTWSNVFSDGAIVEGESRLRFRSAAELRADLREARFEVRECYGDFHRSPYRPESAEIVVVATAR